MTWGGTLDNLMVGEGEGAFDSKVFLQIFLGFAGFRVGCSGGFTVWRC